MATPDDATIRVTAGVDGYAVHASAVRVGNDLVVTLWGGDRPHVGAVAAAHPRPSLADGRQVSATASVLTFSGHCEDEIAREAALTLAKATGSQVVVSAGMHWESLPGDKIPTILANVREVIRRIEERTAPPVEWSEKRSLMELRIIPSERGWSWSLNDCRWGHLAKGDCDSFEDAREQIEKQWSAFRVIAAHGLLEEMEAR